MIVTFNKMSCEVNDEALETCQQEVNDDIMMYFALEDICIGVDDFSRLTLQEMSDKLSMKKFRNAADSAPKPD